jgi:hypothetical protein
MANAPANALLTVAAPPCPEIDEFPFLAVQAYRFRTFDQATVRAPLWGVFWLNGASKNRKPRRFS